jgi:hypothetical protein
MSKSNADCGMRIAEYLDRKDGTANCLPLTEDSHGRRREGGCLRMPVAISGSGDCPAKHRGSLNLEIGPKRLVHIGYKTQSPWRCLTQHVPGMVARNGDCALRLIIRIASLHCFGLKRCRPCGGQSPLPKTPRTHQVRASAAPRPINQRPLFV